MIRFGAGKDSEASNALCDFGGSGAGYGFGIGIGDGFGVYTGDGSTFSDGYGTGHGQRILGFYMVYYRSFPNDVWRKL